MSHELRQLTDQELDSVSAGVGDVTITDSFNNLGQNLAQNAKIAIALSVGVASGATVAVATT